MKKLCLAWQDPKSRAWRAIGCLTFDGRHYKFEYTRGAKEAQEQGMFQPLSSFPQLDKPYESPELFPLFSNRVLPRSRPEYEDYLEWINLPKDQDDPIALLAHSGGRRATDSLEVFSCPEPDEHENYHIHFFARGLRHLPDEAAKRVKQLKPGELMTLEREPDNMYDPNALALYTQDHVRIGYCPAYLLPDVNYLLNECKDLSVKVERVNLPPAPLQYRLLCNMTAPWPVGFVPSSHKDLQPFTGM